MDDKKKLLDTLDSLINLSSWALKDYNFHLNVKTLPWSYWSTVFTLNVQKALSDMADSGCMESGNNFVQVRDFVWTYPNQKGNYTSSTFIKHFEAKRDVLKTNMLRYYMELSSKN